MPPHGGHGGHHHGAGRRLGGGFGPGWGWGGGGYWDDPSELVVVDDRDDQSPSVVVQIPVPPSTPTAGLGSFTGWIGQTGGVIPGIPNAALLAAGGLAAYLLFFHKKRGRR